MKLPLPELRVGEPQRHGALAVFPLFSASDGGVRYRLSAPALADESVVVEEVGEQGSVPELQVDNQGDVRVLFLEGEELQGAKQDRILNTSVLVASHTRSKLPVSCVEHGRWGYRSRRMTSGLSHSPSSVRSVLKGSVSESLQMRRGYRSNQGAVWDSVDQLHKRTKTTSRTGAVSDAMEQHAERVEDYREAMSHVPGATGVAVAVEDRVLAIDLFDRADTCEATWNRLVAGAIYEALASESPTSSASADDVRALIQAACDAAWDPSPGAGDGEEYRAVLGAGTHASVLVCEGAVVHESIVTA